jgi:methanogenic corrinoid protein MtbC1
MMDTPSSSASALFASEFRNLSAIVLKRLELEWHYHHRPHLALVDRQLLDYALEFGRLLDVVFRHGLFAALREESAWYAAVFSARGSSHDAFALVLDSWIMAIEGSIKPPECHELVRPIQAIRSDLDTLVAQVQQSPGAVPAQIEPSLFDALLAGDVEAACRIVSGIAERLPSPDRVVVDVVLPAMAEIGRRWELNQLDIFQEHLATEAIRSLLAGLTATIARPFSERRAVALVACAPGDQHGLIPMALASYLTLRGWSVRNLGVGLPGGQIARAVATFEPRTLFLTLTMLSRLDEAIEAIVHVRRVRERCRIILGGRGALLARAHLEREGALVALDFDDGFRLAAEDRSDA